MRWHKNRVFRCCCLIKHFGHFEVFNLLEIGETSFTPYYRPKKNFPKEPLRFHNVICIEFNFTQLLIFVTFFVYVGHGHLFVFELRTE